ncbi:MAG: DUF6797 domain-containing protein [Pirellulaceae bacterium]
MIRASVILWTGVFVVGISCFAIGQDVKPFPENRLRGFYKTQAQSYLDGDMKLPEVLPPFPGLDYGRFGHWGQYPESKSVDGSWNDMDLGGVCAALTSHFGKNTNKAVNVLVSEEPPLTAIFDTQQLTFTDSWNGELLSFNSNRFGVLSYATPRGNQWLNLHASHWKTSDSVNRRYLGYFRHINDVVFKYDLGKATILDHVRGSEKQITRTLDVDGIVHDDPELILFRLPAERAYVSMIGKTQVLMVKQGEEQVVVQLASPYPLAKLTTSTKEGQTTVGIKLANGFHEQPIRWQILKGTDEELTSIAKQFRSVKPIDLKELTKGGAARWANHSVTTNGRNGTSDSAYAIDTIEIPFGKENPFSTPMRLGGVDFLPDGRCAVCTLSGDVWIVDGLEGEFNSHKWKRIAAGLCQPLGLAVVDGKIVVSGRDQLTRLHDINGDDEIDFVECITSEFITNPGHDVVTCLDMDDDGNFYFDSSVQGVLKYSPETDTVQVLGSGLRNPNGLGVRGDGDVVLATVQEGSWTPASAIHEAAAGSFHGLGGPREGAGKYGFKMPLCFVPRGIDHSSGGLEFLPSDERLGPLAGQIVGSSFGNCTHYIVLREEIGGRSQGGVVPLTGDFLSGAHRIKFNKHDGSFYIAGSSGWQCYFQDVGSLQRVRHTGKPLFLPTNITTHRNGFVIRYNCRLDPESIKLDNVLCQQWNYLYSAGYGSSELSARDASQRGHDPVNVKSVHLLPDGQSVFLEIPSLAPVMQIHLFAQFTAKDSNESKNFDTDVYYSVFDLGKPFTDFDGYVEQDWKEAVQRFPTPEQLPVDPRILAQEKLKFQYGTLQGIRAVTVRAVPGLKFDPNVVRVSPGELVAIQVKNDDPSMPHNMVILQREDLNEIGQASMLLAADPMALALNYVPSHPGVIHLTPVLAPGGSYTVYYKAPSENGIYPFICTFPGHWKVMRGVIHVADEGEELPEIPELQAPTRPFVKMWMTKDLVSDLDDLNDRSATRGQEVFTVAGCIQCHKVNAKGADLGPDLSQVTKRFKGEKLLKQILNPSAEIHKDYQAVSVITVDGETLTGLVMKKSDDALILLTNPLKPNELTELAMADIEELIPSKVSTMPKGLLMTFSRDEILDLMRFLHTQGE